MPGGESTGFERSVPRAGAEEALCVQEDVGAAAAACQAVPGDVLPRAQVPGAAGDAAAANRASRGSAAQRLPEDAAAAAERAPAAVTRLKGDALPGSECT